MVCEGRADRTHGRTDRRTYLPPVKRDTPRPVTRRLIMSQYVASEPMSNVKPTDPMPTEHSPRPMTMTGARPYRSV